MLKFVIPQPGLVQGDGSRTGAERPLALSLQDAVLDAPLNANGAYDLSALQPGLEWHDLCIGDVPAMDSVREQFAVEAGCNEEVLKWASVPVIDENAAGCGIVASPGVALA